MTEGMQGAERVRMTQSPPIVCDALDGLGTAWGIRWKNFSFFGESGDNKVAEAIIQKLADRDTPPATKLGCLQHITNKQRSLVNEKLQKLIEAQLPKTTENSGPEPLAIGKNTTLENISSLFSQNIKQKPYITETVFNFNRIKQNTDTIVQQSTWQKEVAALQLPADGMAVLLKTYKGKETILLDLNGYAFTTSELQKISNLCKNVKTVMIASASEDAVAQSEKDCNIVKAENASPRSRQTIVLKKIFPNAERIAIL